jgi:phosphotriesterase-related protein
MPDAAQKEHVHPGSRSGRYARTVQGNIPVEELGCTLMHEHVFWDYDARRREACIDFSRQGLEKLSQAGGRTVVDVAPHPYRIPEWYLALAPQVDVHIILSSGFYLERRTPLKFHTYSESQMLERFLQELTEGIQSSRVKAGVIKTAGETRRLTGWERAVLRAAGAAQKATGAPVCCHAIEGGREQFEALCNAGADPHRIYICHAETESGWEGRSVSQQLEYLLSIAQEGGSLYLSNFGWEFLSRSENLKRLVLGLCEAGYRRRLLFSADANYKWDEAGVFWWEEQRNHPALPEKNFAYTFTYTIPLLKRWGFTEADLQACLVENPKEMFDTAVW